MKNYKPRIADKMRVSSFLIKLHILISHLFFLTIHWIK